MTKCEAYKNLKDYLDNVFHNSNDYETYCYLRDCADTLAPPAPDPDTSLLKCGCGHQLVLQGGIGRGFWVACENTIDCMLEVGRAYDTSAGMFETEEEAVRAANRAMGFKYQDGSGGLQ